MPVGGQIFLTATVSETYNYFVRKLIAKLLSSPSSKQVANLIILEQITANATRIN